MFYEDYYKETYPSSSLNYQNDLGDLEGIMDIVSWVTNPVGKVFSEYKGKKSREGIKEAMKKELKQQKSLLAKEQELEKKFLAQQRGEEEAFHQASLVYTKQISPTTWWIIGGGTSLVFIWLFIRVLKKRK